MDPELWHTRPWLAFGSLLPVPLGALWMAFAPRLPSFRDHPRLLAWLTWLATRAAFAGLVWGLLGHAGTDQLAFFVPQARAALAGGLPYRDYASAYGPLFAPLLGLALAGVGTAGPFTLFVAADFAAWRALAAAEGEAGTAAWIYVASPAIWYPIVRYGQDESLAAMFLALAWWAWRRERPSLTGLALGLGFLATKPLFALPALPIVLGAGRARPRLLLTALAPVAIVYGALLAMGASAWQPLALEGPNFGVGPTLWSVPLALTIWNPGGAGWLPCIAMLAWATFRTRPWRDVPQLATLQYGAFAALAGKFMPMYFVMWAPLVATWTAQAPRRRTWLVAYGAVLPLSAYLESGPLQGVFGAGWWLAALALLPAIALLALVPWAMAEPVRATSGTGSPSSSPRPGRSGRS